MSGGEALLSELTSRRAARWRAAVLPAGLVLLVVLHLSVLLRYPEPSVDEAWTASRSWALLQGGWPVSTLDRGVFDLYDPRTVAAWLPVLVYAPGLALGGNEILLAARLTNLAGGLALLGAVYALGRVVGGTRLGWLAAGLVALSGAFFYSAHLVRPDTIVAALGFGAIALALWAREGRPWLALLAGLAASLAFEGHAYGAVYFPAILALFLARDGRAVLRQPALWTFLGGGLLGALLYLGLHVLADPRAYFATMLLLYAPTRRPPLLGLSPASWLLSVAELLWLALGSSPWLLPIAAAALLYSLARWRSLGASGATLVVLAVGLGLAGALLISQKHGHYAIFFTPAFDLVTAFVLLRQPWREPLGPRRERLLLLGIAVLLAAHLGSSLADMQPDRSVSYARVQARINALVEPGDVLIGTQTYWFGLPDHTYYSWESLIYYRRRVPQAGLEEALRALAPAPDVLVIDGHIEEYLSDDASGGTAYWQGLRLSRRELEELLARRARLLADFHDEVYGRVRVYRFEWDSAPGGRTPGAAGGR
jgi:4-amino-4-deoxy-L-arabinose transferase-like glycosyltransferase